MNVTVGGSVVNALSKEMDIEVVYGGNKYSTSFEKGVITSKTSIIEKNASDENRGTTVIFTPDEEIWSDASPMDYKALRKRIKQIAYLNPGLTMYHLVDTEDKDGNKISSEDTFCFEEGLKDYIKDLSHSKKVLIENPIYQATSIDDIDISIAFTYTDKYNDEIYTFCNNMATVDNGDHLNGFISGINTALKKYIADYNINLDFKNEDIKEGLIAVVAVRVKDPNFEGQAKTKLRMNNVKNAVNSVSNDVFYDFLDKNPDVSKLIIAKIEQAQKARIAAQKARESIRKTKSILDGATPSKLADCSSKNKEECEIYLVEGDSAAGSAKSGRDRKTQAILPVFGKIINVEKKRFEQVIKSDKIMEAVKALKTGIHDEFDIEKLRYNKIIIMSDSDVDGYHIACLWITFFYRHMRDLLVDGHIYMACPPRFKMTYKSNKIRYAFDDAERDKFINEFGQPNDISYLKGYGN